jgi:signal transduction histidine kinase
VALKVKVGLAQAVAEPESKTRPVLAELKQDADAAIDQLRELARGVYPPLLASDGLEAALRAHLRRMTVAAELDAAALPRHSREVESAIYFCCLEALQNVSKYAQATRVEVRIWSEGSLVAFAVEDNGKGFDPSQARDIHGLENMRDRLEALGGTLTVRSAPGAGTRVEGKAPGSGSASPVSIPATVVATSLDQAGG